MRPAVRPCTRTVPSRSRRDFDGTLGNRKDPGTDEESSNFSRESGSFQRIGDHGMPCDTLGG